MKRLFASLRSRRRIVRPILWGSYGLFVIATIIINITEFTIDVPPAIRPEVSTFISIIFIIIGTIYAAYDLLGGAKGPLRWITLVLTYAVVGALGIGQFLGLIGGIRMIASPEPHMSGFAEFGLLSGFIGLLAGVFGGILIALRSLSVGSARKKVISILLSGFTGTIISAVMILIFSVPHAVNGSHLVLPVALCAIGAMIIQGILLAIYHYQHLRIRGLEQRPRRVFSWIDASMGLMLAVLVASSYALYASIAKSNADLGDFIGPLIFLAIPFVPATALAHFLFWRISQLSKYTLALLGLLLIITGTLLQLHAPGSRILNYIKPPQLNDTVRDGFLEFTVTDSRYCTPLEATNDLAYCVDLVIKNTDYSNEYFQFDYENQRLIGSAGRSFWIDPEQQEDERTYVNIEQGKQVRITLRFLFTGGEPRAIYLSGSEYAPTDGVEVRLSKDNL